MLARQWKTRPFFHHLIVSDSDHFSKCSSSRIILKLLSCSNHDKKFYQYSGSTFLIPLLLGHIQFNFSSNQPCDAPRSFLAPSMLCANHAPSERSFAFAASLGLSVGQCCRPYSLLSLHHDTFFSSSPLVVLDYSPIQFMELKVRMLFCTSWQRHWG